MNPSRRFLGAAGLTLAMLGCAWCSGAAESDWQPIQCVPADPTPQQLFQTVRAIDGFESSPLQWQALNGEQNARTTLERQTGPAHDGAACLRVDYEFAGDKEYQYIQLTTPLELAEPGAGFGFWIKTDGTPFPLRLRLVDRSGETHQVELMSSAESGWQFAACAFDSRSSSWGGDGNQQRDYPCRLGGLCIDRPQRGYVGKGTLWIDQVTLLRPREPSRTLQVEVAPVRFGNLYAVGDSVTLRARGQGERLRWTVTDFWGNRKATGEGPAAGIECQYALNEPGYYVWELELLAQGQVQETHRFRSAALPGGAEPARSDFVGVCSHFGQRAYPLESMDLMRRYGIDQFRDEISWASYEREKGRLALPDYAAAYLDHARALGMRPLIIFDYNNRHYDDGGFPNSAEAIAGFAAYALDLARQTRGTVGMFEVWNEWVGGCGMNGRPGRHDGTAYGHLLKPTYETVKRAFPDLTVVGIGGEYGPKCADHILDAVRAAGPDSMDAWSIHPYRYPRPPESSDLAGEVRDIARRVGEAGVTSKIWITEIGYPTHRTSGGSDEAAQARLVIRTLVLLQSTRLVEKVFWYDFKDDGVQRDYNEHNFGLVHHQQYHCAPKPGVVAMSVFIRMTGGAALPELQRIGEGYAASYRRPDGSSLVVAWMPQGKGSVTWTGELTAAVDLMGRTWKPQSTLQLSEAPVYLVGRRLTLRTAASNQ